MPREKILPPVEQRIVREEIRLVTHEVGRGVAVHVATLKDGASPGDPDPWDESVPVRTYWIGDDDYRELMADRPAFAPQKPAGQFRREDLWPLVDRIQARRDAREAELKARRAQGRTPQQ